MRCPLCEVSMKEVERRGVMIDVCPECRGVWLDRGELEKLLATAEGYEEATRPGSYGHKEGRKEEERWEKRNKRRGLLGEIFDFDFFD